MTPEQNVIIWSRSMLGTPMVWGETDCAMLALKGIDLMTGSQHFSRFVGMWATEAEALETFSVHLPSVVLIGFGATEITPPYTVLGDVITVPSGKWPESLHFVLGKYSLSSDPESGVGLLRTKALIETDGARVWRVPCPPQSH